MSSPLQQVSLVKFGKVETIQGDAFHALRFLTRVTHDQASTSVTCGGLADPDFLEIMLHACKESALSQLDKDQILEAICPPREWSEDGKRFRQFISKEPASRKDVIDLNDLLNEQLSLRQARPDGICPIRRELADQCFNELIRQVTIGQAERGLLLLRVRDELHMTLAAYQDLFVSGRNHDPRKTVAHEIMKAQHVLQTRYNRMSSIVTKMEKTRDDLRRNYDNKEQILREAREMENTRHNEEFQFLKRVHNTLKQQILAMLDPDNDNDPIIVAFDPNFIEQKTKIKIKEECQKNDEEDY